jgi:hypothetical protein
VEPPADPDRKAFPLLDSEPPPRPWWRRLIIAAGVLAVAALAAALVLVAPWSAGTGQPAAARLPAGASGRIVSLTAGQNLVMSGTDGQHLVRLPGLDQVGQQVTPALDNRYLSLGDGLIVTTAGRRPAMAKTKIYPFVSGMQGTFGTEPFSDRDQDLLAMVPSNDVYNQNAISEFSLATGKTVPLGVADLVSGDWQTAGAFVSVGKKVSPIAAQNADVLPDTRVELRTAGHPAVLLGTAATFNRAVSLPASTPVELDPYPSTSGSMVAVAVQPTSRDSKGGIVILSRTGKLIATIPRSANRVGPVNWSPSGRTFTFSETDSRGQGGLSFWTLGGRLITRAFPRGADYGSAIWSPDGTWVLAAASFSKNPNAADKHWVIGRASGGPVIALTGPGTPIAWLP